MINNSLLLKDIPLSICMKKNVFHVLKGEDDMQALKEFLLGKGFYIGFAGFAALIMSIFFIFNLSEEEKDEELLLPWEEEIEVGIEEEINEIEVNFIVDIKGEVVLPSIYHMEEGDRVQDAVNKAGGFTKEANQLSINLAERCYDEMVIYVPSVNEEETDIFIGSTGNATAKQEGVLINQADSTELTVLPGIGPAKAEAIVSFREENGPFKSIDDITKVPGIGEKTLETIRDQLVIK